MSKLNKADLVANLLITQPLLFCKMLRKRKTTVELCLIMPN